MNAVTLPSEVAFAPPIPIPLLGHSGLFERFS